MGLTVEKGFTLDDISKEAEIARHPVAHAYGLLEKADLNILIGLLQQGLASNKELPAVEKYFFPFRLNENSNPSDEVAPNP